MTPALALPKKLQQRLRRLPVRTRRVLSVEVSAFLRKRLDETLQTAGSGDSWLGFLADVDRHSAKGLPEDLAHRHDHYFHRG